jgi:hypothetical protein
MDMIVVRTEINYIENRKRIEKIINETNASTLKRLIILTNF